MQISQPKCEPQWLEMQKAEKFNTKGITFPASKKKRRIILKYSKQTKFIQQKQAEFTGSKRTKKRIEFDEVGKFGVPRVVQ